MDMFILSCLLRGLNIQFTFWTFISVLNLICTLNDPSFDIGKQEFLWWQVILRQTEKCRCLGAEQVFWGFMGASLPSTEKLKSPNITTKLSAYTKWHSAIPRKFEKRLSIFRHWYLKLFSWNLSTFQSDPYFNNGFSFFIALTAILWVEIGIKARDKRI